MKELPLKVTSLNKQYRTRLGLSAVRAVDSIDFSLEAGEILGFLGPNGAGKTTTIKCILGLLTPSSGSIALWNMPPATARVRRRIGYVPENPDYEDIFTPLEMMMMFDSMRGLGMTRSAMMTILDRVGLKKWEKVRIRSFSKGMRQRVSLALALQSRPDLLIMDEPTGGLDPVARKEFRDIILEENGRGASVFLSSHLLSEVETICSRAVILSRGEKVAEGALEDLMRTEDRYTVTWSPVNEGPKTETVFKEELQTAIDRIRSEGGEILSVNPLYRSLEDVFLKATGGGEGE